MPGFKIFSDEEKKSLKLIEDACQAVGGSFEGKSLGCFGNMGCFYWYDNNWHYFRQWDHLKKLSFATRPPIIVLDNLPDYAKVSLPQSDKIISRTISMLIKLAWNNQDFELRGEKMARIFDSL